MELIVFLKVVYEKMKIEVAVLNSGLFILIEDVTADVHDKCLCILCDKKLKYKLLL